jgi:hypothetical protein
VKTTDLRPVLHAQHLLIIIKRVRFHPSPPVQDSADADKDSVRRLCYGVGMAAALASSRLPTIAVASGKRGGSARGGVNPTDLASVVSAVVAHP